MEMAMAMETGMESRGCIVAVRSHRIQTWVRVQGECVVEWRGAIIGGDKALPNLSMYII